jgi:hypothetical protein
VGEGRRIPSASLIVGWEKRLVLLEVPLARPAPPPAPEGAPTPPPQATPPPAVTRMWEAEAPIVGLAWLEGPSLALLCEHGPRTILLLYDASGVLPSLPVADTVLPRTSPLTGRVRGALPTPLFFVFMFVSLLQGGLLIERMRAFARVSRGLREGAATLADMVSVLFSGCFLFGRGRPPEREKRGRG